MSVLLNLTPRIHFKRFLPFIILIFLIFLLRIPSFFEPHWYFDEGVYSLFGKSIATGNIPYLDVWDHKPLGIYLIYSLAYVSPLDILVGAKIFAFLSASVGAVLLFFIAKQAFPRKVALLSAFLFAIFSSLPFFDGNQANGEIFFITPVLLAIYLFEPFSKQVNPRKLLLAGLSLGVAISIKQVAIVDLGLLVFLLSLKEGGIIKNTALLLVGSSIIPGITALLALYLGTPLKALWFATFEFNLSYVVGRRLGILFNTLKIMLAMLVIIAFMKKGGIVYFPLFMWLAFDSIGVLMGGQPFPHYLIQVLPAISLILAVSFWRDFSTKLITWTSLAIASFILFILVNSYFRIVPYGDVFQEWSYYPSFFKGVVGADNGSFNSVFSDRWGVERNQKVVSYLNQDANKDKNVYIWGGGTTTWLYYDLGRPLPSQYVSFLHVEAIRVAEEETMNSLKTQKPGFIVTTPRPTFPELTTFIKENYSKDKEIEDVTIYKAKKLRGD